MTKMDMNPPWYKLVERAENFRWNIKTEVSGNEAFFMALYDLKNECIADLKGVKKLAGSEILAAIFSEVYNLIVRHDLVFMIFHEDSPLHDDMYNACLFTMLCMFLHESRRIEGMSLGEFVFQHSPNGYSKEYSSYQQSKDDRLTSEETTLRQNRNRLFSFRAGRDKNPQWSAMRKDSEHEWSLYFILRQDDENQDKNAAKIAVAETFKRIGNLYKDVNVALASSEEDGCTTRLEAAYKKFLSKLKKLKYVNYLELQKEILRHISDDKTYYGINLYRFEKAFRLFVITHEVRDILSCRSDTEEANILMRSLILNDIWFPRLYKDFSSFPSYMGLCAGKFSEFLDIVVFSACLIFDELIEKNCLGDHWESLFIRMTNEMAERVFYAPDEIDFTAPDGSQEKFIEVIDFPVRFRVSQAMGETFPPTGNSLPRA